MRQKIAKNTLILLFSRFGSRLLIFFFGIWVARTLGAIDFGKITFATAFILTFAPLADFGIENFLLKEISRRLKERIQILQSLFYPRVFLAIFAYFLAISLGFLLGYEREDLVNLSLYGLMLLPYSLNYFFLAYFNAQEKVVKSAVLKIFYPLAHIVLGVAVLCLGLGYRWLLATVVVANVISALIMLFFYPQILGGIKTSWARLGQVIQKTWPFAALVFLAVLYLRADVLILKKIAGNQATGLYGPVTNLLPLVLLIPESFTLALFPTSSRLVQNDKKKMSQVYLKGLVILFLTSLPLVIAGFFLTPFLVPLFLGSEYLPSIPALQVIFLSFILFFVNALPGNVILASQRVKKFIPWAVSNLAVNLLLNFILIPQYSLVGAAWAKLLTEVYGLAINNFFVYRILKG